MEELKKMIKFFFFSVSAGLIEIGVFTLINELITKNYWCSYMPALILSVLWNFTLNRKFTFKSASNVPIAMFKVFIYYLIFTPLSTGIGDYLVKTLLVNEYIVTIGNMIVNLVTEFLYQKYIVFKDVKKT